MFRKRSAHKFSRPQVEALRRSADVIPGADMPLEWSGRGERNAEDEPDTSDDPNRPLSPGSRHALENRPAGHWEVALADWDQKGGTFEHRGRHPLWESGTNRALLTLGRAVFGGFFVYNAINHFRNRQAMSGYAASKKVPAPDAAVVGSGMLILIGGLSLLSGMRPKIGAAAVITFLAAVSPMMHDYWNVTDPMQQAGEHAQFTKNLALLGAALLAAAAPEPWPYAINA